MLPDDSKSVQILQRHLKLHLFAFINCVAKHLPFFLTIGPFQSLIDACELSSCGHIDLHAPLII